MTRRRRRIGSPAGTALVTIILAALGTSEKSAIAYAHTFAWLLVPLVAALILSARLPSTAADRSVK